MGLSPDILNDGGFVGGSFDVVINGFAYTLDTFDLDDPVSQADANKADGTPKGGLFVKGKKKCNVKIMAVTGIPSPAQLIPFAFAFDGQLLNWTVTNRKLAAANTGANIRTYTADIVQYINPIPA